jgi:putative nucleotidyltransferase with HDIG domain
MSFTPNRDAAWQLLTEYTTGDSLLKHALAVEVAVRGYARAFDQDEEGWGVVALLHDFDYERWPSADDHPFRGSEILRERGYPEWVIRAILSHAEHAASRGTACSRKRCLPVTRWPASSRRRRSSGRARACSISKRRPW